jgi:hypothetical protein
MKIAKNRNPLSFQSIKFLIVLKSLKMNAFIIFIKFSFLPNKKIQDLSSVDSRN